MTQAMSDDYGSDHHLDEEIQMVVSGIPGRPGVHTLRFHSGGELAGGGTDTFDTADGKPHPLGRKKASETWNGMVYTNQTETIDILDAWVLAARNGEPGNARNPRVRYPTASGKKAHVVELQHCFPTDNPESAPGQQKAHERNYQFRYWRKRNVPV